MKTSIKRAEQRGDEYGQAIIIHILSVSDLVASDSQYHSLSMRKLYNRQKTQEKRKRGSFANDVEAAMEKVYTYLENSDGVPVFARRVDGLNQG